MLGMTFDAAGLVDVDIAAPPEVPVGQQAAFGPIPDRNPRLELSGLFSVEHPTTSTSSG